MDDHTAALIVFLANLTEPSHIPTFTPPECRLRAAMICVVGPEETVQPGIPR